MRLQIKPFALACGLIWGMGVFFLTWWILLFNTDPLGRTLLEAVYIGYTITPAGSFIGLIWGFVDGLIGGAVFAYLYNMLVLRMKIAEM